MLFPRMVEALDARDVDAWGALLHDDYEFIRHANGTIMNKDETLHMMRRFMASEGLVEHTRRCLYESDAMLVMHSVMDFPDGSREAVLIAYSKQDGLLRRAETGATPLPR